MLALERCAEPGSVPRGREEPSGLLEPLQGKRAGAPSSSFVTYGRLDREGCAVGRPIELRELADRDWPSASMSE